MFLIYKVTLEIYGEVLYVRLWPPAHPCMIRKAPFLSLSKLRSLSISERRKGAKKSSSQFLATLSPEVASGAKFPLKYSVFDHTGQKLSLWRTHHHHLPTTCFHLWAPAFLASISGTGEPTKELLWLNKPVRLFQFGVIWLTTSAEKPIQGVGDGVENLLLYTHSWSDFGDYGTH